MDPNIASSSEDLKHLTKSVKKLQKDFKNLLTFGDHSDVVFKVKGKDFKAHRSILSSRSAYFSSMFRKDTSEKKTVVTIEDCDPNVFESLLEYIYTGKTSFSQDSIARLFLVADRYKVQELKDECVMAIVGFLSKDNFCDYVRMSDTYPDMNLAKMIKLYFRLNAPDIISTFKWQTFMKENPEFCNKLFCSALKKLP